MTEYYYAKDGQAMGPVEFSVLQQLAAGGTLQPLDYVCRVGDSAWSTADRVVGLSFPAPDPLQDLANGRNAAAYVRPYGTAAPYVAPYAPSYGSYGTSYGAAQPLSYNSPYVAQGPSYSGQAITGFVFSLVGLIFCGPIMGIVAIIVSATALSNMKKGGNYQGKGLATAGLVIGIIDVAVTVVAVMVILAMPGH